MKVMRMSALVTAFVAALVLTPTTSALNMASAKAVEKQCKAMATCNKGGVNPEVTCTIGLEKCPPCVTFNNNGCFELLSSGTCPFGEDCSAFWNSDSPSGGGKDATSSGSTASSKASGGSGTAGSSGGHGGGHSPSAGVSANSSSTNSTSSSKSGDSSATSKGKDGGTDMTVVFGIVGAAIGVIAVAVIFLALVRRSRAAEEDDDEMAATPPTKAAGPSTTTNAAAYAPYAQRAPTNQPANPTTPTNRVLKYYNDNAQPSPHGSRGGGFGSQPGPQQPPVKTVRPAAAANAPTFFNKPNPPMASAVPPQQAPAPAYQEHNQNYYSAPPPVAAPPAPQQPSYQEHNYHQAQVNSGPRNVQQAEPLFTVHTGPDEPQVARRVSSPRPRRESYEF